jgi:large subunit ribosomal protein L5
MENEFYDHYKERVMPALQKQHGYKNVHQVPKVEKVVINTSVGSQSDVKQALEDAKAELALITGQSRGNAGEEKHFEFQVAQRSGHRRQGHIARRAHVRISRAPDQGGAAAHSRFSRRVAAGFDGHGNYTLGVSDQSIFPEVELDKIKRNIGFDVTIVTTARTNEEAKSLLSEMGMPFSDRAKKHRRASRLILNEHSYRSYCRFLARVRNGARRRSRSCLCRTRRSRRRLRGF